MDLVERVRSGLRARKRARTEADVHAALNRAYEAVLTPHDIEVGKDRLVIFSDHHKGGRDGADDFQRCERTYNAALAYYHKLEYHLIELGDVEELWENSFEEAPRAIRRRSRSRPPSGCRAIHAPVGQPRPRVERLGVLSAADARLRLWRCRTDRSATSRRQRRRGTARRRAVPRPRTPGHGRQGPSRQAQPLLRPLRVAPVQRLLNRPWNTPSMDWDLRGEHAEQMARWAENHRRVLIAGHTHMPVFFRSAKKPAVTPADVPAPASNADPASAEALTLARREWAKAEAERLQQQPPLTLVTPCYFNTGCCSFGDGDITGLEIRDGQIRLVRWPCTPDTQPDLLEAMELADVSRLACAARHLTRVTLLRT